MRPKNRYVPTYSVVTENHHLEIPCGLYNLCEFILR